MRGFSSFLISSRTRFPSRSRGILLNHNLRRAGTVPMDRARGLELRPQRFGRGTGLLPFQLLMKFRGNVEEFAIAGLPDFEKRTRIETAFNGSAAVEAVFERLADEILFEALAAGVLQDRGEPEELLAAEAVEGIDGVRHWGS